MAPREISADELVEHATFLFGAQWRDALAAELGISRKSLVISLASGDAISAETTFSIIRLLDRRLEEMQQEQDRLRNRISALRGSADTHIIPQIQPRGQLQHAC